MITNSKYTEKIIYSLLEESLLRKDKFEMFKNFVASKKATICTWLIVPRFGEFLVRATVEERRILNHDSRVRAPQDKFAKKHVHLHNYIQQLCALLFFKKFYTCFVLRIKLQFGKNQHTYKVTTKWEHWNWNEVDN